VLAQSDVASDVIAHERLAAQCHYRNVEVVLLHKHLLILSEEVVDWVPVRAKQADDPFVRITVRSSIDCDFRIFYELFLPIEG